MNTVARFLSESTLRIRVTAWRTNSSGEESEPLQFVLRDMTKLKDFVRRQRLGHDSARNMFDGPCLNLFPDVYKACAGRLDGRRVRFSIEVLDGHSVILPEWPRHSRVSEAVLFTPTPELDALEDLILYVLFAIWVSEPDTTPEQLAAWGAMDSPWRTVIIGRWKHWPTIARMLASLAANAIMCARADPDNDDARVLDIANRWRIINDTDATEFFRYSTEVGSVGGDPFVSDVRQMAPKLTTVLQGFARIAPLYTSRTTLVVVDEKLQSITPPDSRVKITSLTPCACHPRRN